MNRFPHPSAFGTLGGDDSMMIESARTWQWGTGRPIYRTTTSSAQTGPRFDTGVSTQTGPRFENDKSVQVNSPMPFSYGNYILQQANQINVPMSPYERYIANNSPMSHLRIPNMGQAISSGLNIAENEHMYGRTAEFQAAQNAKDRSQAMQMQRNTFDQQAAMQASQQIYGRNMAATQFGYDSSLQQNQFRNEQQMQQNQFGQDRWLQSSSQQFQQGMAGINYGYQSQLQHQSILGNLANTATGGIFGIASEGVHELGEYINQKSNQNFQEKMNPIVFNQNKQLQSAQITGNLENTGIQMLGNVAVSALSNAASIWMNHSNNEFEQAQQTRNFNNTIYANGQSAQALKIAN